MVEELYNERILNLAASLEKDAGLPHADVSITLSSPICGSRIKVDLCFENGRVMAYGQQVRACTLGQTAAAIMAQKIVGQTRNDLETIHMQMRQMLAGEDILPSGDWSALAILQPARNFKSRHASVMLPFNAVIQAMDAAGIKTYA